MSKGAELEEKDLIVIVSKSNQEQLPTFLFEEAEEELTKLLISEAGKLDEERDGAFDLIAQIVNKIRHQIEKEDSSESLKNFLFALFKIFTLLLNSPQQNLKSKP